MIRTVEDREKSLWIAAQKYMSGDMKIDELEAIESIQAEKLREAMLGLSKQNVRQKLWKRLSNLINPKS